MKALMIPALAGLVCLAGCKKTETPDAENAKTGGEPNVAELQKRLDETLSK